MAKITLEKERLAKISLGPQLNLAKSREISRKSREISRSYFPVARFSRDFREILHTENASLFELIPRKKKNATYS